jgi:hypothetical protein
MNNALKIGDTVEFLGGKVYGLPNMNITKYTKTGCTCIISSIKLGEKHPYLIKSKYRNRKLQGWVELSDIRAK